MEFEFMSNGLPKWINDIVDDFLDHMKSVFQLLAICIKGIHSLEFIPAIIEAFEKESNDYESKLRNAQMEVSLAQSEEADGYPFLHAQMAVNLWASLESFMRNLLVGWLKNIPDAIKCDEIRRLKVKIGEYESIRDEEDKYNYILDLLEDHLMIRRSPGIGRFNSLLSVFGLSVSMDENLKRDIYELYCVRNVLVHRRGVADLKIVENCPWLNLQIGQRLMIRNDSYHMYQLAVSAFVLELMQKLRSYFGLKRADTDDVAEKCRQQSNELRSKRRQL
jgi:hypothetical protein